MSTPESKTPFKLDAWLEERTQQTDYVLVELGHSKYPVAARQDFVDRRLYVGVEAWYYRSPQVDERMTSLSVRSEKLEQNIVFIDNPTGRTSYVGETYDPETVLPAGIADEVFLGNVFGDPIIAFQTGRTDALLSEARRLMGEAGRILIRETYTPHYTAVEDHAADVGLEAIGHVSPYDNPEAWNRLEALYAPLSCIDHLAGRPEHRGSFYLLLAEQQ